MRTSIGARIRAGTMIEVCVQVRPAAGPSGPVAARNQAVQQYPVDASGLAPCVRAAPRVMHRQLYVEKFFTESLILAQDERWRRA